VASLVEAWSAVEGHMRTYLSTVTDEDLARTIEYTNPRGEKRSGILGSLMQHGATHGVHHRGQVVAAAAGARTAPGNVDLLFYDSERTGVAGMVITGVPHSG
jgi:uncharacterized damage-inducible protein DinB